MIASPQTDRSTPRQQRLPCLAVVSALLLLLLSGCSPVYVLRAGAMEAEILWKRTPIAQQIASPVASDEEKRKLALVLAAREFAQSIGLAVGGSYRSYSDIGKDPPLWVVSATPRLSFTPYTWWFPFVGSVPYKGFFSKAEATAQGTELEGEGYDVFVRGAPAFSSLGWFDDPMLSTVLNSDDVTIVDTVIHEVLHNTIWIKGSVSFNETVANFVGTQGAVEFFRSRDPSLAQLAAQRLDDEILFSRYLAEVRARLTALYEQHARGERNEEETLVQRKQLFEKALACFDLLRRFFRGDLYLRGSLPLRNNAFIVAAGLYVDRLPAISQSFNRSGANLPQFVDLLRKLEEKLSHGDEKDPFVLLAALSGPAQPIDVEEPPLCPTW